MGDNHLESSDSDDEGVVLGSRSRSGAETAASVEGKSVDELKSIVEGLERRAEQRKTELAPLLQELRPLRQQYQVGLRRNAVLWIFLLTSCGFRKHATRIAVKSSIMMQLPLQLRVVIPVWNR